MYGLLLYRKHTTHGRKLYFFTGRTIVMRFDSVTRVVSNRKFILLAEPRDG